MTNLPEIKSDNMDEVMSFLGQATLGQPASEATGAATLRVNYNDEDSEGNQIPTGEWTFPFNGQNVFAPEVDFRIMFVRMQYSHYDTEKQERIATSTYFTNFNEEVPDDAGGMKCGKLPKSQLSQLNELERKRQDDIKLSKVMFGFVSGPVRTVDGEALDAKDHPVVFYARGTHYMPMTRYLEDLTKKGILALTVQTKLRLRKKKHSGRPYWEVVPELGDEVTFQMEDAQKTIQSINTQINNENAEIVEKWTSIRTGNTIPFDGKVIDLEADFDED